jgi:hypothetical protein
MNFTCGSTSDRREDRLVEDQREFHRAETHGRRRAEHIAEQEARLRGASRELGSLSTLCGPSSSAYERAVSVRKRSSAEGVGRVKVPRSPMA